MRRVKQSLVELQSYRDIGIHVTDKVTCGYNWYFNHVFFFCMTVVTTIGYGHTAPVTKVKFELELSKFRTSELRTFNRRAKHSVSPTQLLACAFLV